MSCNKTLTDLAWVSYIEPLCVRSLLPRALANIRSPVRPSHSVSKRLLTTHDRDRYTARPLHVPHCLGGKQEIQQPDYDRLKF